MQVVTVTSNKGGVGKTTIATNLAIHFREQRPDLPVLLLGLDDQSLLDRMFAPEPPANAAGHPAAGRSIETAWRVGDLRRTGWPGLVVVDTKSDLEILTQNAVAPAGPRDAAGPRARTPPRDRRASGRLTAAAIGAVGIPPRRPTRAVPACPRHGARSRASCARPLARAVQRQLCTSLATGRRTCT